MYVSTASTTGSLLGAGSAAGEGEPQGEPAINLSNRLNPNNVHYDRELASR
jgi:hypothetical protein